MNLEFDPASSAPPYEQLRSQITALVATGKLAPGTRLPAIRQLANDLGVAGGTVARAYKELEAAGVVETRGRHGTVVADAIADTPTQPEADGLIEPARAFVAEAAASGMGIDDAIAILRLAATSEGT